jgi:autotransporter family porin
MRLRNLVRKLKLSLAGLVGGFAFACSGPNPGEMPPLAPRPEPVQPTPSSPEPSKAPVPGAPDFPTPPDAGAGPTTSIPAPQFKSSGEPLPVQNAPAPSDAGVSDAVVLPEVIPDALPSDAARRPESTAYACC